MFSLKLSIAFFVLKASCTYMPELLIDLHCTSVFMLFFLPTPPGSQNDCGVQADPWAE